MECEYEEVESIRALELRFCLSPTFYPFFDTYTVYQCVLAPEVYSVLYSDNLFGSVPVYESITACVNEMVHLEFMHYITL